MDQPSKRTRGAPKGNQNARKHGFYSRVLDSAEKRNLEQASLVKGLDEEISLIRVKLRSVAKNDPKNIQLISQAASTLARLMRARKALGFDREDNLGIAIRNIIRDIGVPFFESSRLTLTPAEQANLAKFKADNPRDSDHDPQP